MTDLRPAPPPYHRRPAGTPPVPPGPYQEAPNPPAARSIYLYAWSGNDKPGPDCKDAVVVLDATPESATFGQVVNVVFTPTWGNEPHHVSACMRV